MEHKKRVGNITAGIMIATAVLFDGLQALLILTVLGSLLSYFFTFLATIIFSLWFLLLKVNYFGKGSGNNLLIALGAAVTELVPFINAFPAITAGVVGLIVQSRIQDAKEHNTSPDPKKLVAVARLARMRQARSRLQEAAATAREAQSQSRHPDA